jgi:hypothetical protein
MATALALAACSGDGGGAPSPTAPPARASTSPRDAALALCGARPAPDDGAAVASDDLVEISGLVRSNRYPGVLWAHNDSGDTARVFAIGADGAALGTFTLQGADAVDWEDIAIGPGPLAGTDYLYLADIGDNAAARPEVVVYRVPEPGPGRGDDVTATLTGVERITLRYSDGAHDAETLLVDPATGEMVIVTKAVGAPSQLFHAAAVASPPPAETVLEPAGAVDFTALRSAAALPDDAPALPRAVGYLPTGGDVSPDGGVVAIRTYGTIWVWAREPGTPLAGALAMPRAPVCEARAAIEPQGEAVAIDADGSGYRTASEGAHPPLHHYRAGAP